MGPPIGGPTSLGLLIASSVLASTSSAQVPEDPNWRVGGWGGADFEPTVAVGNFTPGIELDAVANDAGTPYLLIAPESYLTRIELSVSANDMATRPAISGASVDTLLTVGSGGLIESSWNATTSAWTSTVRESSAWVGARRVLVGDLNGANELDVVALGSGARTVLVLHGTNPGFFEALSFTTGSDAYDLCLIDWDGNGDEEIAALTDWGVELFQGNGTPITSLEVTYSTLLATAIADGGSSAERLALVIDDPVTAGRQWLVCWTSLGVEGPDWLGDGLGVRHAQTADWNGDGNEDLVLLLSTEHGPRIYYNQQSVGEDTFDPSDSSTVDPTFVTTPTLSEDNEASVGFGDFDHDGDVDALLPLQGNWDTTPYPTPGGPSEIQIVRNDLIDETDFMGFAVSGVKEFFPSVPATDLTIVYDSPASLLTAVGGDTLAMEYTMYGVTDMESTLPSTATAIGSVSLAGSTFTVEVELPEEEEHFTTLYAIRYHQVVRNSSGDIVAIGPAWVDTYTEDDDLFDELTGLWWITNPVAFMATKNGSETQSGGAGMGPNLPPTDDDMPPDGGDSMP